MFRTLKQKYAALVGIAAVATGNAYAALPAGVETAIDGLETDGLALIAAVTAVVVAFIGPEVVIKLVKRFSRKV